MTRPKTSGDAIAIAINPERLKAIDFSDPYAQIEMGVLVGKGAPISALGEHELRSGSLNPTSSCQEDA